MGLRSRCVLALTCFAALAATSAAATPAAAQLLPQDAPVQIDLNRVPGVSDVADTVEGATGVEVPGLGSNQTPSQPLPEAPTGQDPAPAPSPPASGGPAQPGGTQGGGAPVQATPAAPPLRGDRATAGGAGAGAGAPGPTAATSPAASRGAGGGDDTSSAREPTEPGAGDKSSKGTPVTRFIGDIESLPWALFALIAVLSLLGIVMAGRSAVLTRLSRRLRHQRSELREDVGALQSALLPQVPERIGDVEVSVAYQPKDGPAAGGDFHDVIALDGDRIALVVGDVSGHGREALTITALAHYTVRAYLEAGLEPREAMRLADEALGGKLGEDFVTVVAAHYDPAASTFTYATAGHPAPIVAGAGGNGDGPVHVLTPPPIGVGPRTGFRQTSISIPPGAAVCLFSDGLVEARLGEGAMLEREGLERIIAELGEAPAAERLLEAVATRAGIADDTTACVLRPLEAKGDATVTEELDLNGSPTVCDRLDSFLEAFGMPARRRNEAVSECRRAAAASEGARLVARRDAAGAVDWKIAIAGGAGSGLARGSRPAGVAG